MKRDIPIARLMPGDILLYRGRGLISDAIRFIDRSQVSHAALFVGRHGQKGRTVGEAVREGVIRRELPASIGHAEWVEARRLKEPPASLDPVMARAAHYLDRGERYAFEQVLLLALLCLTRNLAGSSALAGLIRETLDAAAGFLLHLVDTGREPMICSEFVYRCYSESLPGAIALSVRAPAAVRFGRRDVPIGRGSALSRLLERHGGSLPGAGEVPLRAAQPAGVSAVEERIAAYFRDVQDRKVTAARVDLLSPDLLPSFERFAASLYRARCRPMTADLPREAVLGALLDAAADFVTPGDLQRSRSLAFCGKLKAKE
ncbi:MAG: hypothetical protein HPY67_06245 [Syntrophaceae bacterium]|nr:hypothetical protein [Syntrophaceae bacterium]